MVTEFTGNVIRIIGNIPPGKVLSYGRIAFLAGSPRGARQVTTILHSSTGKYDLPWHRVVNSKGRISFGNPAAYSVQKQLLESEGIVFSHDDRIDLKRFLWRVRSMDDIDRTLA